MSEYFKTLIDNVRKDERDKIFSAIRKLMQENPKIYGTIDYRNIDDLYQSVIIELKEKESNAE